MVSSVAVVGDANVDLVLRGDVVPRFGQAEQLLDEAQVVLGGSAAIVACGLARLGVPTSLVARVGADTFGELVRSELTDVGVDISQVSVDDEVPTGMSVILSSEHDRAILTMPGTIGALDGTTVIDALAALDPTHVHVASFFLQPALAADLPMVLALARRSRATTSLDTNWDPSRRWEGVGPVLGSLDWLLPNLAELDAISHAVGADGAMPVDRAAALARRGPRVVVKAGAQGGWSTDPSGVPVRAAGLAVDVVDTTGAGDSFDAGYLAAVAHGVDDEEQRLRWAAAAGSLSARGSGGTARQATLAELYEAIEP